MTKYFCDECGREITRDELEKEKVKCPNCESHKIRKEEEDEE